MDQATRIERYRRELIRYSDEEIDSLLHALAETNWQELRRQEQKRLEQEQKQREETCPQCRKQVGKEHIDFDSTLPEREQKGCSDCLQHLRRFRYPDICEICNGRYHGRYRRRNSCTPYTSMCPDCYPKHKKHLWRIYYQTLYLAQRQGLPATLTLGQLVGTLDYFDWKCAYCGGAFETIDHVLPRIYGGGSTLKNCLPSCRRCNRSKHTKLLHELTLPQETLARIQHYLDTASEEQSPPDASNQARTLVRARS